MYIDRLPYPGPAIVVAKWAWHYAPVLSIFMACMEQKKLYQYSLLMQKGQLNLS